MNIQLTHIDTDSYFNDKFIYCPVCDKLVCGSNYLFSVFHRDEKLNWLANIITHFRHNHHSMYNEICRTHYVNLGKYYNSIKAEINEGIKRKIIINHAEFLIKIGVTSSHFAKLQNTKPKTIELAKNKIDTFLKLIN